MAKKIYAVIYKNESYTFDNWNDCKNFVSDKKNIIYRGFVSSEEAQDFIFKNIKREIPFDLKDVLYMYVDGSTNYINKERWYSYGICGVKNLSIIYEDCDADNNAEIGQSYQIGGELKACIKAVEKAVEMGEERVIIVYDYMGIEMWANGSWKPKEDKPFVKEYVEKIQDLMKKINIDFIHVNSHINNGSIESNFNNRADELANIAIAKKTK